MQTPKARTNSSEVQRKISPRSSSLEVPSKISPRAVPSEGSQKVSPRVVRQLKTTTPTSDSATPSNRKCRTPKDKSPRVDECRESHSTICEKPSPSKIAELESQISQLQSELEKLKDQLSTSEVTRKLAQEDADESKKQLQAMLAEIEESQEHLAKHSAIAETMSSEVQKASKKQDQELLSVIEPTKEQYSVGSASLASALAEIQELRFQLEMVVKSEASQIKQAEDAQNELHSLKENQSKYLVLVEDLKDQLRECRKSEADAKSLATETLSQLETAKSSVKALILEVINSRGDYDATASDLEMSREQINALEDLVNKYKAYETHTICNDSQTSINHKQDLLQEELEKPRDTYEESVHGINEELHSVKSEVVRLRSALEAAEIRFSEEQNRRAVEMRNALELVEQIKSISSIRENELETKLKNSKTEMEIMKADLMDKQSDLEGIREEKAFLNTRLSGVISGQAKYELEIELEKSISDTENLKANLMDKETQLQNLLKENEMLKLGMNKNYVNLDNQHHDIAAEVEASQAAEREALMKVGYMMEEVDKSNWKATRVAERLDAAQAAKAELEAELRRLKVQAHQWQKAAEAAAAMLSSDNNGKYVERTGSMDIHYSPGIGKVGLPYMEDVEGDYLKRKNSNMFKKIGTLWKKPQK